MATNKMFYPITDKDISHHPPLSLLQEIEIEQCLAQNIKKYYFFQIVALGVTIATILFFALLLFLKAETTFLFISIACALIFCALTFCFAYLYHEGIKNKERYEHLLRKYQYIS